MNAAQNTRRLSAEASKRLIPSLCTKRAIAPFSRQVISDGPLVRRRDRPRHGTPSDFPAFRPMKEMAVAPCAAVQRHFLSGKRKTGAARRSDGTIERALDTARLGQNDDQRCQETKMAAARFDSLLVR
jgi:hypothetical protein